MSFEKYCPNCKEDVLHERWNDKITQFLSCERCGRMEVEKKLKPEEKK